MTAARINVGAKVISFVSNVVLVVFIGFSLDEHCDNQMTASLSFGVIPAREVRGPALIGQELRNPQRDGSARCAHCRQGSRLQPFDPPLNKRS
jgi:hypothetical protein